MRAISACASSRSSGGSASALSLITSTAVPPRPKTMTGPKVGSSAMPAISSRAFGRTIIGWIVTPVMRASGFAARARAENVGGGLAHGALAGEIEPHAADFRFVHDVRRKDFARRPRALGQERRRCRGSFVGIAGEHARARSEWNRPQAAAWPRSDRATCDAALHRVCDDARARRRRPARNPAAGSAASPSKLRAPPDSARDA